MKKGKFVAIIVLALVLTRLPLLLHPFIDVDEALFAVFARVWLHGGIPYVDVVEGKALGIYYFYILASWLSGNFSEISMMAVHALSIVWTALTAGVIARITTRLSNARMGLWSALFFVLFTSFYIPKIIATSMAVVFLLPFCWAMDLVLRSATEIRFRHSFWAGILISAGIIVKYQAGIILPVILVYYWFFCFSARKAFWQSLWLGLGCLPLPALMLWQLHGLGAIPDFLTWNFGHTLHYIQTGAATIDVGRKLLSHVLPYLLATQLLWILAAMRAVAWWRQGRSGWREDPRETGVWIWFFLSIIPICMGYRFYGHYFLMVMPQLCILSALQLSTWPDSIWRRRRPWIVGLLVVLTVASSVPRFAMPDVYRHMQEEYIDDYQAFGEYLRSQTRPEDRILVWGFSPAVYWYAQRLPATRFLWSDVLVGRVFGLQEDTQATLDHNQYIRPEFWQMFFADMQRHRPAYIIDMAPTGMHHYQNFPMIRYPLLMNYVGQFYEAMPDFMGAKVFKRKGLPAIPSSIP